MTQGNRNQLRSFLIRARQNERLEDVLYEMEQFIENEVAACPFPADQIMLRDYRNIIEKAA